MKTYFILLALVVSAVISYGQVPKKFIYKAPKEEGSHYIVSPSFEEPRNEALKKNEKIERGHVYSSDLKELFPEGLFPIAKKAAISTEKLDQLRKLSDADIWKKIIFSFKYSGSGKFCGLAFLMQEEHLGILDDKDLYVIYKAFETYSLDVSKVDFQTYDEKGGVVNAERTDKYYWRFTAPLWIPED